ncbi:MAG: hypothetical protein PVF57_12840 [Pseudomonadales bacterium]|jgi:hypothetical protein
MPHTIEPATSGRARCRACGTRIAKGALRFGERLANPFGDEGSETTHWYHPRCGAYRRPASFSEALASCEGAIPERAALEAAAAFGIAHRRVERINGVERAPSGRARCRQCRETIDRGDWRIGLVFFEEGMTHPAGYIHAACAADYLETTDLLDRLQHFGPDLSADDLAELAALLN